MKLRLEADPAELQTRGDVLLTSLSHAVEPHAPALAESLRKAIPERPPVVSKHRALRELTRDVQGLYADTVERMLAEVGQALDRRVEEMTTGSGDGSLMKGGPFIGPQGGLWADPKHTVHWDPDVHGSTHHPVAWAVPIHAKISGEENHVAMYHVTHKGNGNVMVSRHKDGQYGQTMPVESLKHFRNDLSAVVDLPPSGNPDIDAVTSGKAKFLGKGDDGMAFHVGDKVVKVSSTVPYHPDNPGHRSPEGAADMLRAQVDVGNHLADLGVPCIQRSEFIKHGDKGFQIKPWVRIPEKFTRAQLDKIQGAVIAMHEAGYAMHDQIQPGLDDKGEPVLFDIGKAAPLDKEGTQGRKWAIEDDVSHLQRLYEKSGVDFINRNTPQAKQDFDKVVAMSVPKKDGKRGGAGLYADLLTMQGKKLLRATEGTDEHIGHVVNFVEALRDVRDNHGPIHPKLLDEARKIIPEDWHDMLDGLDKEKAAKAGYADADDLHKSGPFIGPNGGLWADAKHTIHWDPAKHGPGTPVRYGMSLRPPGLGALPSGVKWDLVARGKHPASSFPGRPDLPVSEHHLHGEVELPGHLDPERAAAMDMVRISPAPVEAPPARAAKPEQLGLFSMPAKPPEPEDKPSSRRLLAIVDNDPALTQEQKLAPTAEVMKAILAKPASDPGQWKLPAGARFDPWEPKAVPEDAEWEHPDFGSGTGAAPWQQGDDWKPDFHKYDVLLVNSSAGKDSQAMLSHVVAQADAAGFPREKIVVVHCDLGRVEWEGTKELAIQQAQHYGLRVEVVQRTQNDLLEQIEERHGDLTQRQEDVGKLVAAGIRTWADLAAMDPATVQKHLGEGKGASKWEAQHRAEELVDKAQKKLEAAQEWEPLHNAHQAALAQHAEDMTAYEARVAANPKDKKNKPKAPKKPKGKPVFAADPVDFGKAIAWPSSDARFCTSDHKRAEVKKLMTRLADEHREKNGPKSKPRILNALGLRAQESDSREAMPSFEREEETGKRTVDRWYPIHRWKEDRVWSTIAESGVPFHKAYSLGMRRLSCAFCVFAQKEDLMIAAKHNPDLFQSYLDLEQRVGSGFTADLSLADVADEIKRRRAEGMELDETAKWVKKALAQWEEVPEALIKAELEKAEPDFHAAILTAAFARLGADAPVVGVTIDWKTTGACVHLDDHADSHHVLWMPYPEAYNASMTVAQFAMDHGLSLEENNAPAPLPELDEDAMDKAATDADDLSKSGPFIGPQGGLWADPKHTIHWDPALHGPVAANRKVVVHHAGAELQGKAKFGHGYHADLHYKGQKYTVKFNHVDGKFSGEVHLPGGQVHHVSSANQAADAVVLHSAGLDHTLNSTEVRKRGLAYSADRLLKPTKDVPAAAEPEATPEPAKVEAPAHKPLPLPPGVPETTIPPPGTHLGTIHQGELDNTVAPAPAPAAEPSLFAMDPPAPPPPPPPPAKPADPRRTALGGILGKKAPLYMAATKGTIHEKQAAKYVLVEAESLIPSHQPQKGFAEHPAYPKDVQTRPYDRDEGDQMKVHGAAGAMNPEIVFTPSVDAMQGPPVITEDGVVLGGNGRTMALQLHYASNDPKAQETRDFLAENAGTYGFTEADVRSMKNPVVVRQVETPDKSQRALALLVHRYNESSSQELQPLAESVADARRLDDTTMSALTAIPEDGTLKEFLGSADSRPFVSALRNTGIINQRNATKYVEGDGLLNTAGKNLAESILTAAVLPDVKLLEDIDGQVRNSLTRAAPYVLAAAAGSDPDWDLRPALKAAARDLITIRSKHRAEVEAGTVQSVAKRDAEGKPVKVNGQTVMVNKEPTVDEFLSGGAQGALIPESHAVDGVKHGEDVLRLLFEHGDRPTVLARVMSGFLAEARKNPKGQGGMFGSLSAGDPGDTLRKLAAAVDKSQDSPEDPRLWLDAAIDALESGILTT
jgi:3'-phosphoadenosine 5'-phosphosulfate sulfotransferase (PAPS reductase)/FAD synthetase